MSSAARLNVLGTGISVITLDAARDFVLSARGKKQLGYICHATAYGVEAASRDTTFRAALNGALLTNPDGMPLVWLARWRGRSPVTRVYGPDLLLAVCDAGRAAGLTHFFLGGAPGVADTLKARLTARFPGLLITGTYTPPFRELTPEEFAGVQSMIARARPDVVWVGISSPKQEEFMAARYSSLEAGLLIGVGAAFDFHSGRVAQAPRWMQRSGLEWLHRLAIEPRRLWPRYLVRNPLFVIKTFAQLLGLKKYPDA